MKKEGSKAGLIFFNKLFLVSLLFFVIISYFNLGFVIAGDPSGFYYPSGPSSVLSTTSTTTSTTTATAAAPVSTFKAEEVSTWIIQSPLTNSQWTEMIKQFSNKDYDIDSKIEKLSSENKNKLYDMLYKLSSYNEYNKILAKLNSNHVMEAWNRIPSTSVDSNKKGSQLNAWNGIDDKSRTKLLTSMNSQKDAARDKSFVDLYKSMFEKDGKLSADGKAGLKSLVASLNDPTKEMNGIREKFVLAVSQDKLPISSKDKNKKQYKGLKEFKIDSTAKDYKLGVDDSGNLLLKKGDKSILDINNAQVWTNEIKVDSSLKLSLTSTSDGRKLTFTSGDIDNLNSPIKFDSGDEKTGKSGKDFGTVEVNGLKFNPYYGVEKNLEMKVTVSKTDVTIKPQGNGWVKAGNNFFTTNRDTLGSFEVRITKVGNEQVNYGKNVDVAIVLEKDYNPYNSDGSSRTDAKSMGLRTQGSSEVAFLNLDQTVSGLTSGSVSISSQSVSSSQTSTPSTTKSTCSGPDCCPGGSCNTQTISSLNPLGGITTSGTTATGTTASGTTATTVASTTSVNGFKISITGVDGGMSILGSNAGTSPVAIEISKSSNIEVARFNTGQVVSLKSAGGTAQKVTYQDNSAGIIVNPSSSEVSSGSRLANVLTSIGVLKATPISSTTKPTAGVTSQGGATAVGTGFSSTGGTSTGSTSSTSTGSAAPRGDPTTESDLAITSSTDISLGIVRSNDNPLGISKLDSSKINSKYSSLFGTGGTPLSGVEIYGNPSNLVSSNGQAEIQFSASWCGPCQSQKNARLSSNGELSLASNPSNTYVYIDVEKQRSLALSLGYKGGSIPQFVTR